MGLLVRQRWKPESLLNRVGVYANMSPAHSRSVDLAACDSVNIGGPTDAPAVGGRRSVRSVDHKGLPARSVVDHRRRRRDLDRQTHCSHLVRMTDPVDRRSRLCPKVRDSEDQRTWVYQLVVRRLECWAQATLAQLRAELSNRTPKETVTQRRATSWMTSHTASNWKHLDPCFRSNIAFLNSS